MEITLMCFISFKEMNTYKNRQRIKYLKKRLKKQVHS